MMDFTFILCFHWFLCLSFITIWVSPIFYVLVILGSCRNIWKWLYLVTSGFYFISNSVSTKQRIITHLTKTKMNISSCQTAIKWYISSHCYTEVRFVKFSMCILSVCCIQYITIEQIDSHTWKTYKNLTNGLSVSAYLEIDRFIVV